MKRSYALMQSAALCRLGKPSPPRWLGCTTPLTSGKFIEERFYEPRSAQASLICAFRSTLSRPQSSKPQKRNIAEKQKSRSAVKQRPKEQKDTDSLQWGPEKMQPSKALQDRLKGLKPSSPQLIEALPDEDLSSHSHRGENPQEGSLEVSELGESQAPLEAESLELQNLRVGNIQIKSAEYSTSSVKLSQCPAPLHPEIAVIGRSNVGKSSLINMLTGRKELALVSKTPGKTRCINHFLMNKNWYLVDLPGYGYAKTSRDRRFEWGSFTQEFFKKRHNLINVLLLVDASVPTQNIDLGCARWLFEHEIPFSLIFTKIDKRKKKCPSPQENILNFERELSAIMGSLPISMTTSSADNLGKKDLLIYLAQLRELAKRSTGGVQTS